MIFCQRRLNNRFCFVFGQAFGVVALLSYGVASRLCYAVCCWPFPTCSIPTVPHQGCVKLTKECWLLGWDASTKPLCPCVDVDFALQELSFDYQWEAHHLRENTKCLCGTPQCR